VAELDLTRDLRLLDRLRDLNDSLVAEVPWFARTIGEDSLRPDILRDLGERLAELGTDLIARADDLCSDILATLPAHGWLPQAGARRCVLGVAHQVGPRPLRCGSVFLALCGAACFPFYGTDPAGKTARHERCEVCVKRHP
jgi:hypothetical protein